MKEIFLLKLGEIVLKGANKRQFESRLRQNVRRRMKKYGNFDVYLMQSTVYVEPMDDMADVDGAWEACRAIFGVVSLCRCRPCEKNLDAIPGMQDSVLYDTVDEQPGDVLYRNPTVGDADNADASANGIMTTSASAEEAPVPETEAVPPTEPAAAPDHMSRENENPAGMGSSPETFAADTKYTMNVQTEPAAITVLRAVIGTERLDNWLLKANYDGDAAQAIIRHFDVQREDFLAAAADLNLEFTQHELNDLFGTPLTED